MQNCFGHFDFYHTIVTYYTENISLTNNITFRNEIFEK